MLDYRKIKTHEDLDAAKESIPRDQAECLEIGCTTWGIIYQGGQRGQITIWPDTRTAVCFGGNSDWGYWIPDSRIIVMDGCDEDGYEVTYDDDGERI